ncbi:phosphoethanolamine/phosphocholine phosphatase [Bicyclus anynana]|uniref:Phosphoethanolamine/phosphocholine phosphatase n=1 Tax=Bicyclus anynana TaxID=110368 RepID=A0A6J1MT85_BICAN|nr:phosphoethanolamine/phosphocholine phosphatase [Bicyclus anynana]
MAAVRSLAVFDFDRTIVEDDSDATIINRLREKKPPPEWEAGSHDWTPYMSDVFEHAYSAGFHPSDILESIASMRPTPGILELLHTLAEKGWDVLVLTDANSVFVNHWLKTHGVLEAVTDVVTNRAFWRNDRLYIEPCMRQSACARCPSNLCKSLALARWSSARRHATVAYAGDGRNDYCPATALPPHAVVFPRRGFPMHDLIKKTLSSPTPQVRCRVVPWDTAVDIARELFPEQHS